MSRSRTYDSGHGDLSDLAEPAYATGSSAVFRHLSANHVMHSQGLHGNGAAQEALSLSNSRPSQSQPKTGTAGAREAVHGGRVPFGVELASLFGMDLSDVEVQLGCGSDLDALGASATAEDGTLKFAATSPPKKVVAHEVAHLAQDRRHGSGGAEVSSPTDDAEKEAELAAEKAVRGELPVVAKRTSARTMRYDTGKGHNTNEPAKPKAEVTAIVNQDATMSLRWGPQGRSKGVLKGKTSITIHARQDLRTKSGGIMTWWFVSSKDDSGWILADASKVDLGGKSTSSLPSTNSDGKGYKYNRGNIGKGGKSGHDPIYVAYIIKGGATAHFQGTKRELDLPEYTIVMATSTPQDYGSDADMSKTGYGQAVKAIVSSFDDEAMSNPSAVETNTDPWKSTSATRHAKGGQGWSYCSKYLDPTTGHFVSVEDEGWIDLASMDRATSSKVKEISAFLHAKWPSRAEELKNDLHTTDLTARHGIGYGRQGGDDKSWGKWKGKVDSVAR